MVPLSSNVNLEMWGQTDQLFCSLKETCGQMARNFKIRHVTTLFPMTPR